MADESSSGTKLPELSDVEFERHYLCSRAEFAKMKPWKQKELEKSKMETNQGSEPGPLHTADEPAAEITVTLVDRGAGWLSDEVKALGALEVNARASDMLLSLLIAWLQSTQGKAAVELMQTHGQPSAILFGETGGDARVLDSGTLGVSF